MSGAWVISHWALALAYCKKGSVCCMLSNCIRTTSLLVSGGKIAPAKTVVTIRNIGSKYFVFVCFFIWKNGFGFTCGS